VTLLDRIRHAELPGGIVVDIDQETKEMKSLSTKVQEQPVPPERKSVGPAILPRCPTQRVGSSGCEER